MMCDFSSIYSAGELSQLSEKQLQNVVGRFDRKLYAKNIRALSYNTIKVLMTTDQQIWEVQSYYDDYKEDNDTDDEEETVIESEDGSKETKKFTRTRNFEYFMDEEEKWLSGVE